MARKWIVVGVALLALVALLVTGGIAMAQSPSSATPPATKAGCGPMRGGYGMGMRGDASMFATVADLLGVTPQELAAEVQAGKTPLQVAQEHGKTAQDIVDALLAARAEWLQGAVTAGRLTQEQADQRLATMREKMTSMLESGACRGKRGAGPVTGGVQGRCRMGGRGGPMGGRWGNAAPATSRSL